MPSSRIRSSRGKCCDLTRDIPDVILKQLEKRGGVEGLLTRLPTGSALHAEGRLHQALADPIRLSILSVLRDQPLCVCVIKVVVDIPDSKLSYHLNILKEQGLIIGEQQGTWIIYSLTDRGRTALKCTERMGAGKGTSDTNRKVTAANR